MLYYNKCYMPLSKTSIMRSEPAFGEPSAASILTYGYSKDISICNSITNHRNTSNSNSNSNSNNNEELPSGQSLTCIQTIAILYDSIQTIHYTIHITRFIIRFIQTIHYTIIRLYYTIALYDSNDSIQTYDIHITDYHTRFLTNIL